MVRLVIADMLCGMASLTLDWIQLAAVVGALQGLLLTGVLVARRDNRTANRLLGVLMATFTLYLASSVYYSAGLVRLYPHFFGIAQLTPWVFGPLVYLYAVAASDRSWRSTPRTLLHFLPVTIILIVDARYYLMSGAEKIALYDRLIAGDVPARIALLDPFKYVSGLGYSVATVVYLRRHRRRAEYPVSNKSDAAPSSPPPEPEPQASLPRYERSGLDDREAKELEASLRRVMDVEHPWKQSDLTLADLAVRLDTTPHKLSEVLNSQIGQTFYDFVNGYRVREVQRRIRAGESRTLKMLALALDAGFASKSTFNQAFKKHTAQTLAPSSRSWTGRADRRAGPSK